MVDYKNDTKVLTWPISKFSLFILGLNYENNKILNINIYNLYILFFKVKIH